MRLPRARRQIPIALALILLSAGCAGFGAPDAKDSAVISADGVRRIPAGERTLSPNLSGETLTGERLDIASLRGRIVVLNLWASWCAPCRGEAPALQRVYADLRPSGVEFVGLNTSESTRENARAFETRFGIGYPSLWDPDNRNVLRFGTYVNAAALPNTVVLDRSGAIAASVIGRVSEGRLRDVLTPLLAEPAV
ncbi:TlpA family protein disulfide reductase [Embleya sp. NBC_00888]|uniref:TlpA family protein disulfide reductase n=1 Tax=Embleya sp. NBC_00888 TaxID=2975960 RepID=UPI003869263C|nr:TlpA family protein disulfide reductase [Embleya sp. NBC_00888]